MNRDIEVKKVLKFPPAPSFGKYKRFFPPESISHPAKAHTGLLTYLILSYTKEGDVILDPMAGTGSTVVISMLNNRNAIGIDIEERFVVWAKEAIRNVENKRTITPKGKGIAICGDARNLSELLREHEEETSHVLFSPPYGEAHPSKNLGLADGNRKDLRLYSWLKTNNPKQIDNLSFDATIFSPPYSLGHDSGDNASEGYKERLEEQRKHTRAYSIGNIAKLSFVDCCLFSPPYEASLEGTTRHTKGGIPERDHKLAQTGTYVNVDESISHLREHGRTDDKAGGPYGRSLGHPYSKEEDNIGNLKKETYLEAMRKVYAECYKVLKHNGLMILILKNFIRNKSVVPLTEYTIKLCESIGFKLKERLLFKLPQKSFWRVLYEKRFPEVNTSDLQYEYIIIFEKEGK